MRFSIIPNRAKYSNASALLFGGLANANGFVEFVSLTQVVRLHLYMRVVVVKELKA